MHSQYIVTVLYLNINNIIKIVNNFWVFSSLWGMYALIFGLLRFVLYILHHLFVILCPLIKEEDLQEFNT